MWKLMRVVNASVGERTGLGATWHPRRSAAVLKASRSRANLWKVSNGLCWTTLLRLVSDTALRKRVWMPS